MARPSPFINSSYVKTTITLAYLNVVLALVRTIHHYIAPLRLRILATFARHSEFVASTFDFGSKDKAFTRKVAAHSAYTVSYSDGHGEEGGKRALTRGNRR